jgi:predicted GNAT family acetyltransferase
MQQFRLVKKDIDADSSIEIATYQSGAEQFVVCKNEKRIGWARNESCALQIHDMYMRIHILHGDNSDSHYDAKIKEMRLGPQNNSFLHDIPVEELAAKKKLLPWNLDS